MYCNFEYSMRCLHTWVHVKYVLLNYQLWIAEILTKQSHWIMFETCTNLNAILEYLDKFETVIDLIKEIYQKASRSIKILHIYAAQPMPVCCINHHSQTEVCFQVQHVLFITGGLEFVSRLRLKYATFYFWSWSSLFLLCVCLNSPFKICPRVSNWNVLLL